MQQLLGILVLTISLQSLAALKVTIDPGHGGSELGAVYGGVIESKVVLQISKRLFKRLQQDPQFKPRLLRTQDQHISLEDRVAQSEHWDADLFLSIHANANPSPKARGVEFYIQNQLPVDKEELFLAHTEHSSPEKDTRQPRGDVESILYDLEKSHRILKSFQVSSYLQKKWPKSSKRRIRQGPFFVLSQNTNPAVLVEVGYLTNAKERQKLTQASHQAQLVKKIHLALKDYAKNVDKLPLGILKPTNAKK